MWAPVRAVLGTPGTAERTLSAHFPWGPALERRLTQSCSSRRSSRVERLESGFGRHVRNIKVLEKIRAQIGSAATLAAPTVPSWNQIEQFLRDVKGLRGAA
jgi:hypothetical protein